MCIGSSAEQKSQTFFIDLNLSFTTDRCKSLLASNFIEPPIKLDWVVLVTQITLDTELLSQTLL